MTRVVYIRSLTHSGSTLTDLLLGGHSRVVGVGELHRFLDPPRRARVLSMFESNVCTCGAPLATCAVWSGIRDLVNDHPGWDFRRLYQGVIDLVRERYGPDTLLLDSSKSKQGFQRAVAAEPSLRAIHLIKDVRSFIDARQRQHRWSGAPRSWWTGMRWMLRNQAMERELQASGAPWLGVGYDELCLETRAILQRICSFLEIDFEPAMLSLAATHSHAGFGNPMSQSRRRSSELVYDYRWLMRPPPLGSSLLVRPILSYNASRVYANLREVGLYASTSDEVSGPA